MQLLKHGSSYSLKIFSICSSGDSAKLTSKFRPLLNQPAGHGPFWPKLRMPLATIFVEIFEKEKNWWGFGPIGVTSWKDFEISLKKWCFWFFCRAKVSIFTTSTDNYRALNPATMLEKDARSIKIVKKYQRFCLQSNILFSANQNIWYNWIENQEASVILSNYFTNLRKEQYHCQKATW